MPNTEVLIKLLSSFRFSSPDEKTVQSQLERHLTQAGFVFEREYRLDAKNIPDFFIDGIAIELKLKGSAKAIYKQVERYSLFSKINALILVTNRSMGFPKEVNGKPIYVVNLGKAWL